MSSVDIVLRVTLALSAAVCLWVYAGYPALLAFLAWWRPRPVDQGSVTELVSIIVPAFNEETEIRRKVENCLSQTYPSESLEVLVASDGSTDGTSEVVSSLGHPRVRLLDLPRRGKAFALNDAVQAAQGGLLIFTDANTRLADDAVEALVASFDDPEVGAVTGSKIVLEPDQTDTTAKGEGAYWRFENWQKEKESLIGSCYIGDGALHAVRKALYVPIERAGPSDDMVISMRVVLQGRRLIYEPRARVYELALAEAATEFRRKRRVTTQSLGALFDLGAALVTSGFYSMQLISHKLLRHLVPFFLLPLLVSTSALALQSPMALVLLVLQLLFYTAALVGLLLRRRPVGRLPLLAIPYYFAFVNSAAFLGTLTFIRSGAPEMWVPRADADD